MSKVNFTKIFFLSLFTIILAIIISLIIIEYKWNRGQIVYPFYKIVNINRVSLLKDVSDTNCTFCLSEDSYNNISNYNDTIWILIEFQVQYFDTAKVDSRSNHYHSGYGGTFDYISNIDVCIDKKQITDNLLGFKKVTFIKDSGRKNEQYYIEGYKHTRLGKFKTIKDFIQKVNEDHLLIYEHFRDANSLIIGFYFLKKDIVLIKDTMNLRFEMKFSDGRIIGKEIEVYK